MSDTAEEIRQREQSQQNETPALDSGGGGGESDGLAGEQAGLSVPISRRHLLVAGVVVAVVLAYWLHSRQTDGSDTADGSGMETARETLDGQTEADLSDPDGEDDKITVEQDAQNPLAADASVIKEFRQRGILSPGE